MQFANNVQPHEKKNLKSGHVTGIREVSDGLN